VRREGRETEGGRRKVAKGERQQNTCTDIFRERVSDRETHTDLFRDSERVRETDTNIQRDIYRERDRMMCSLGGLAMLNCPLLSKDVHVRWIGRVKLFLSVQ